MTSFFPPLVRSDSTDEPFGEEGRDEGGGRGRKEGESGREDGWVGAWVD